MVPIGGLALKWLEKYLYEVRPTLLLDPQEPAMYVSQQGDAISSSHVAQIVTRCIEGSGLGISGSCHLFRHTMATLMLENGADIGFVQAMLGHAHLDTTQIYTQVAINKLKEIHEATHPAKDKRDEEKPEDQPDCKKRDDDEQGNEKESHPETSASDEPDESSPDGSGDRPTSY